MSDEQNNIVINLESKVQNLIKLHNKLKDENEKLNKDNKSLLESREENTFKIKELEQKIELIKTSKIIQASEPEIQDAKTKINRIVREIDNCIALLNR